MLFSLTFTKLTSIRQSLAPNKLFSINTLLGLYIGLLVRLIKSLSLSFFFFKLKN